MLRVLHAQHRRLSETSERRFASVRAQAHTPVHAYLQYMESGSGSLAMVITGATPLRGQAMAHRPALNGAAPLEAANLLQPADHISADVDQLLGQDRSVSLIVQSVSLAQARALSFPMPVPADMFGVTGQVVSVNFPSRAAPVSVRLGQVFSYSGADLDADRRVLIYPEPLLVGAPGGLVPPAPLHEAFIPLNYARQLLAALHAALGAGANLGAPPAAAAAPALAAGGVPLGAVPGVPPGQGAAQPAVPVVQPAVGQNAAPPAPAGAGAGPRVHWAAGVGGQPAQPAVAAMPVAPGVPVQAPSIFAILPSAPVANLSMLPHCRELFSRCSPGDLADLPNLDSLVAVLASTPSVPPHAVTPANDPMARLEFIEYQIDHFLPVGGSIPPRLADGWAGVFPCARAARRDASSLAHTSGNLSNSFGSSAGRHQAVGQAAGLRSTAGGVAVNDHDLTAIINAGTAVDAEGLQPASNQPLGNAVYSLATVSAANPTSAVPGMRALGAALTSMPPAVQILEAAGAGTFSAVSSAHMSSLNAGLITASSAFVKNAAKLLRGHVAAEPEYGLSVLRSSQLEDVVRNTMRGRIGRVSESMLDGSAGLSLTASLRAGDVTRTESYFGYMDFVVRCFTPQSVLAADNAAGETFFEAAKARVRHLVKIDKVEAGVVADWVDMILAKFEDAFNRFYSTQLLLRPVYSPSYLTAPDANAAFEELVRKASRPLSESALQQMVSAAVAAQMAAQSSAASSSNAEWAARMLVTDPLAHSFSSPPESNRAKKKRARAGAARSASAAAPVAVAPVAVAPVAVAAAPPPIVVAVGAPAPALRAQRVPAVNASGVLDPPAFVGNVAPGVMAAFSEAHLDAAGNRRCFNFWRRGVCNSGDSCRFSHL